VEICAQIEAFRLLANGKLPEYADGHQHVHILPGMIKLQHMVCGFAVVLWRSII